MTEKGKALWILAMLSPVIAEMLSGSSPPREFFNPFSFMLLLGLYGAGVLVVRELSVIWSRGWMSVIVMGAAYGILEEGVAVKSFFDPNWMDLGGLGVYGRYLGTNWVWATWLTIFHSAVSITLPIFLLSLLYPHLNGQRLLTRKRFEIVLAILSVDVLVCTTLLNPYVPFWPMYLVSIAAVLGLFLYAKHLPRYLLMPEKALSNWTMRRFVLLGFAFLLLCFIASAIFSKSDVPFVVPIVLEFIIAGWVLLMIWEHMGSSNNRPQKAGLVVGMLCFFVFVDAILVLGGWFDMLIPLVGTVLFMTDLARWSQGRKVLFFKVGRFIYGGKGPSASANGQAVE